MKQGEPQAGEKQEQPIQEELQPNLLLPEENSDEHPLMKKYAKISEQAMKNSPPDIEDDSNDLPQARVG